jgi:hypothetical protein
MDGVGEAGTVALLFGITKADSSATMIDACSTLGKSRTQRANHARYRHGQSS